MFQAPSNIPTLFKGDKVVIYGILKSKAGSDDPLQSGVQGKASLKGHISGESFTHSVSFDVPAPPLLGEDQLKSSTGFDIPVIHHLAAKSLLSDWKAGKGWSSTALTLEREQDSTNLSIESSVVCEHTAFVAVDKEKQEQIEEPMIVHDITTITMEKDFLCAEFACESAPLSAGCFNDISQYSKYDYSKFDGISVSDSDSLCEMEENESSDDEVEEIKPVQMMHARSVPAVEKNSRSMIAQQYQSIQPELRASSTVKSSNATPQTTSSLSGSLTTIISLQHANGFWLLKDIANKIMKKEESEMQCPSVVSGEVWATVVAIVLLERNYLKLKDEWELVALKAEMWLNSQTLSLTIEKLKEKANKVVF